MREDFKNKKSQAQDSARLGDNYAFIIIKYTEKPMVNTVKQQNLYSLLFFPENIVFSPFVSVELIYFYFL